MNFASKNLDGIFYCLQNTSLLNKSILKKSIELHFKRSKVLMLYFYDIYDVILREKKIGRSTADLCRTDIFIEFHHFMKR